MDWYRNAKCIIQSVKISIVSYSDVTEFAALEGEGDKSLAY
ncbi:hypothetical protein ACFSTH_05545 [Paenibacillus yanchengensis]|uniref:Uncharacterized protein n=1 Tax=Paenibacillus yanchengensis TaxID=2035833 RepID=A0ABW4YHP6_9BACL